MSKARLDPKTPVTAISKAADGIRRAVRGALGTYQYKVQIVTRRWSGDECGVGSYTDEVLELDPPPTAKRVTRDRSGPAGREPNGSVVLTGVSLSYSKDQLYPKIDERSEMFYRLIDVHGHGQPDAFFKPEGEPVPRRTGGSDWYIVLSETSKPTDRGVDLP